MGNDYWNRYRCFRYISDFCRASLHAVDRNNYEESGVHSHPNDFPEIHRLQFENWCKEQAKHTPLPLYAIFLQAVERLLLKFYNLIIRSKIYLFPN